MYYNLIYEMANHEPEITKTDIAKCLGVKEKTVNSYINGATRISWLKALKTKEVFFPDYSLDYLFAAEGDKDATGNTEL